MRKRVVWAIGAAAVGVTVALANPGPAFAATALADRTIITSSTAPRTYTFSLDQTYWSVVALQPRSTNDYDFTLKDGNGKVLDASAFDTGATDFVAVNNHTGKQPFGAFQAVVSYYSGSGSYAIQLRKGHTTATLPTTVILTDNDVANIYDIKLNAGDKFWATSPTAGTYVYLLESTSDPATWVQSRISAGIRNSPTVVGNCTLYTANATGSHGLLVIGDRFPTTSSTTGIGFSLHRYDPNNPTC
jgi:hypothetical protein